MQSLSRSPRSRRRVWAQSSLGTCISPAHATQGYIIFMAIAAVIAFAIVAPRRFSGRGNTEDQWGDEDEATEHCPKLQCQPTPTPRSIALGTTAKMDAKNSV